MVEAALSFSDAEPRMTTFDDGYNSRRESRPQKRSPNVELHDRDEPENVLAFGTRRLLAYPSPPVPQ